MSASKGSSFDAFSKVDELVSKPVVGSYGAESWQDFKKDHKSNRPSAAPRAPLKKTDKLGTGLTSWEAEQQNEADVRKAAGQASSGSGYTTFKQKGGPEEAAERKRTKLIESRTRPDDEDYFITAPTFQGWKFNYVFTTREGRGTGYYWDGTDAIKEMRGDLKRPRKMDSTDDSKTEDSEKHPKKKKRKKKSAPVILSDPTNPLEQVAAIIRQRQQKEILPDGWDAAQDPFTRKTYYFNSATGERKWEKPELQASKDQDGDWQEAKDPDSGKMYFFNRKTGERSWEKPEPSSTNEPLPNGWMAVKDTSSGKTYYYQEKTKETRWERPTSGH